MKRFISSLLIFILVISSFPISNVEAAAYDPQSKTEGTQTLDLRFWEDQKPSIGFYINAGNKFILENVTTPGFGTSAGEWSVMDILRGMYAGYDYNNDIPKEYFEDYVERVNGYIFAKDGDLHRAKSTEWSRATLAMSALGIDIRQIGDKGTYIKTKFVTYDRNGDYEIDTSNSANYSSVNLDDASTFTTSERLGLEMNYISKQTGRSTTGFGLLEPGTYTLVQSDTDATLTNTAGETVVLPVKEFYRGNLIETHQATTLATAGIVKLEKPYDFVEKLSTSYKFSYRQGINGPIWILIAMDTGGYELYTEEELTARGVKFSPGDVNTKGRMIDYILSKEITSATGRVGGWALAGKNADPDITMMAVQGLAPYYLDEKKYKNAYETTIDANTGVNFDVDSDAFKEKYTNFKKAVERAVAVMAEDQKANGGYASWETINAESTSQVIVGLTALNIDPLSSEVYLPTINQTVSFIKEGAVADGAYSNNMIDALITFWAMGSGSTSDISGFKHVTTGYDGGGGAGTSVNGMATDQAIYGLIAYDRFLKKQNRLYDMTDMINGEYKAMQATIHTVTYKDGESVISEDTFSPYEVLTIPTLPEKSGYNALFWTTNLDGTGAIYKAGEKLSTPEHAITLYAQYAIPYNITYDLNGAEFVTENHGTYQPAERKLILPTDADLVLANHVFLGWYTSPTFENEAVTEIENSTDTDFNFYAYWKSYEQTLADAIAAIDALPNAKSLTLNDAKAVTAARQAVEFVPDSLQEKISTIPTLQRAEDVIRVLQIEASIAALPETISLYDEAAVKAVSDEFNTLPASLQIEVKNNATLEAAKKALFALSQQLTDREASNAVRALFIALPTVIDLKHLTQIKEARAAYDSLTEAQQSYLTTDLAALTTAEKQLDLLLAKQAVEQTEKAIAKLPAPDEVAITDKEVILTTLALYNTLSDELKKEIDPATLHEVVAKYIDVQIMSLPAQIDTTHEPFITEIQNLYTEAGTTIQKLVEEYATLQQKSNDLIDLPKITKANNVIKKIDAIPVVITTAAKASIIEARTAYNALTSKEKAFVTNFTKLTFAEISLLTVEAQEAVAAAAVSAQITSLPATVTLLDKAAVTTAYSSYQALTATAKAQVVNTAKLLSAYESITILDNNNKKVIQALQTAITALPDTMTSEYQAVVKDIRQKYDALSTSDKAQLTITKLLVAEQQLKNMVAGVTPEEEEKPGSQTVLEEDDSTTILVPTGNSEITATISQQLLNKTAHSTIDIKASNGFTISLPKSALQAYGSSVHVEALFSKIGAKATIEVNFYKESNGKLKTTTSPAKFTVKIPKSSLTSPTAALTEISPSDTNGFILGYSTTEGYSSVPHVYKNEEYIVTLNKAQTLVYSTELISFADVADHNNRSEIEYLANRYVIQGYEDNTFRPNQAITRAQFASLISRALGLQATKETLFKDIKNSSHKEAIQALTETGIMTGKTTSTFAPNEPLTREHAAVVMARVLEYMEVETKGSIVHYTDKNQINKDYLQQIGLLNRLDIMTGRPDGSFGPKESLTRAQLAKILQRTLVIADVM